MRRKVTKILECLEAKTDHYGDIESGAIDRIERTINALAKELGYSIDTYDGSVKKEK